MEMKQEDRESPSLFGLSGSLQPWLSVQFQLLFSDPQSFELSYTKPFTSREGKKCTSDHSPELLTPHTSSVILALKTSPFGEVWESRFIKRKKGISYLPLQLFIHTFGFPFYTKEISGRICIRQEGKISQNILSSSLIIT